MSIARRAWVSADWMIITSEYTKVDRQYVKEHQKAVIENKNPELYGSIFQSLDFNIVNRELGEII